jgi:MFS family permease
VTSTTTDPAANRPPTGLLASPSLLSRTYRMTTAGLLLVVSLVAFENLAVATAMPTAVRELGGLAYYSLPFTAFLAASVIAMVLAGGRSDRAGPRWVMLTGLLVFAVGLVVAGTAHGMAVFVAGRAVQGLGAGMVVVALYVVIAEVYDEALRPRVFAAVSAAWVLPALVGPVVSGLVTEHLSWRLVFGGLVPFVLLGVALVWPALARLDRREAARAPARRRLAPYAVLAALGMAALQYAGQHIRPASLPVALAGLVALVPAVRRLLPAGTVRLRQGLPAAIGYRGLLAGAFFGADAFIPLTLSQVHGYRPALAGLPLTVAAVGWSAGSWWQGHRPVRRRYLLVGTGCALIMLGAGGLTAVAWSAVPGWLAGPLWTVAGTGMGLAMASTSVLVLDLSDAQERGANGAALQIADVLCSAGTIGLAGVLLAAIRPVSLAITAIDLMMAAVAATGVLLAARLRPPLIESGAASCVVT